MLITHCYPFFIFTVLAGSWEKRQELRHFISLCRRLASRILASSQPGNFAS